MSDWLDPVRAALDASSEPVPFFFRDDDAGWESGLLWELLDRFEARQVHIELAVIPAELDDNLATALCDRASTGLVHLHQHGFRHVNHEANGRKYEFGPSRSHGQQLADIAQGRAMMDALLHPHVEPIFTPPWNRCTDQTAKALVGLGFEILSRPHCCPLRLGRPRRVAGDGRLVCQEEGRTVGPRRSRQATRRTDHHGPSTRRRHAPPRDHGQRAHELGRRASGVTGRPSAGKVDFHLQPTDTNGGACEC